MNDDKMKERIAPCGLHCGKCFAFSGGTISKSSRELNNALGQFDIYARRFAELLDAPVFGKYPAFKEMLDYFSGVECSGCRKETCQLFSRCNVRDCSREKGVDFCYQCSGFPCHKTGFDEHLHQRSIAINRRIQSEGLEKYYNEIKDQPRY